MFELDKYSIKARLYPSFLVLVPAFVLSLYYITDFEKYYHYFTAFFAVGLFTFLLAQLGRDKGKSKEPELHKYFGGKPTTQLLRHSNNLLDIVTKNRYYKLLSEKIDGIHLPNENEEKSNPNNADQVYDSCAKYLISKTRDTKKFNLLFKENISYGFRRNLWGMKVWALLIIFICICIHTFYSTNHFTNLYDLLPKDIGLFVFFVVCLLFWLLVVTKKWIKIPAFGYAERLYESLNEL